MAPLPGAGTPSPTTARWAGVAIALAGWLGAPAAHALSVAHPWRHLEGSPAVAALAAAALLAALLLAWPRRDGSAGPHRVGQGALIVTLGLAAIVAALSWALHEHLAARLTLRALAFPLAILALGFSFAWLGRLHRLLGHRRLANLADLIGLTAPLLWTASQLLGGYPGLPLLAPGAVCWAAGAIVIAGLLARASEG